MTEDETTVPNPAPVPAETAPTEKKPRTNAEQDQNVADFISEVKRRIAAVRANSVLAAKMADRGYDAAGLDEGDSFADEAQNRFTARQEAIGARERDSAALTLARTDARKGITDLRTTIRAVFKTDPAAKSALGVVGTLPEDADTFVTTSRATLAAAGREPHAAKLAKRGYGPAGFAKRTAEIDAFVAAKAALDGSTANAVASTEARDKAVSTLREWTNEFYPLLKLED